MPACQMLTLSASHVSFGPTVMARFGTIVTLPPPLVRERAAEVRAAVAAERARWLEDLLGCPREVLAERDGTGHSPEFAAYRLPAGILPGQLVTLTPTRITEGLLE